MLGYIDDTPYSLVTKPYPVKGAPRRLSTLTKLVLTATHEVLEGLEDETLPLTLALTTGESVRQEELNKSLSEYNSDPDAIHPAIFSLSVNNAAAAITTQVLGLTGGYTVVFTGGVFPDALLPLILSSRGLFVVAQESSAVYPCRPFALATILKSTGLKGLGRSIISLLSSYGIRA